jgi:hypothetical protein
MCTDKFTDPHTIREAILQLEGEEKIMKLENYYLPTKILMKKWIKKTER